MSPASSWVGMINGREAGDILRLGGEDSADPAGSPAGATSRADGVVAVRPER
jgi:hypothetical protein